MLPSTKARFSASHRRVVDAMRRLANGRRFGIVYVDYVTQQRTVKKSGLWLKDFLS